MKAEVPQNQRYQQGYVKSPSCVDWEDHTMTRLEAQQSLGRALDLNSDAIETLFSMMGRRGKRGVRVSNDYAMREA